MERLYNLSDNDYRIIDKSGIYPRIYFLQGSNPEEIREWYDFGSIATIYLTSPDFPEITRLPAWICEGVMDNFANNSLIKIDDTLALDFFSVSPVLNMIKDFRYGTLSVCGKCSMNAIRFQIQKRFANPFLRIISITEEDLV